MGGGKGKGGLDFGILVCWGKGKREKGKRDCRMGESGELMGKEKGDGKMGLENGNWGGGGRCVVKKEKKRRDRCINKYVECEKTSHT